MQKLMNDLKEHANLAVIDDAESMSGDTKASETNYSCRCPP